MGVSYATTNPAIAAFNEGMKAAGDRRMQDVKLLQEDLGFQEGLASAPSRISRVKADARIANTAADVAEGTKGANIKIAYNNATSGDLANQGTTVDLNEKRATSPSRVSSTIATNDATSTVAPVEAGVRVQTAPYRVQREQQSAATGAVNVTEQQLKFFKETVNLLEQGRTAEADELARRTGEKIPDEVRNDATMRRIMAEAVKDAEARYPNRPNAQFQHIKLSLDEAKRTGIGNRKQEDRYNTIPGAPPIAEVSAPKNPTAMDSNIDSLVRRGIAKDDKEAFALINQSKGDPAGTLQKLFEAERKIRLDAAKGPGGMATITNTDLERIDREATAAAGQKAQVLKQMAASTPALPPGAVPALAASPAPAVPGAAPAPAAPAGGKPKPWFWEKWIGSQGAAADPAAEYSGAAPAPVLSPSGVPDARQYQQPAPPKVQERAPNGAPPALDPAIQQRAQGMSPDQVREQARAAIAAGKDRNAVLSRLQALGIPTEGL